MFLRTLYTHADVLYLLAPWSVRSVYKEKLDLKLNQNRKKKIGARAARAQGSIQFQSNLPHGTVTQAVHVCILINGK